MKKIIVAFAVALAAVFALAAPIEYMNPTTGAISKAEVVKPAGTTDTGAVRVGVRNTLMYDSGVVAGGVEILSPELSISGCANLTVLARNYGTGAASRLMWVSLRLSDSTEIYGRNATIAVAATTSAPMHFGPGIAGAEWAGVLPAKAVFQYAAAGTGNGRLMVWCR